MPDMTRTESALVAYDKVQSKREMMSGAGGNFYQIWLNLDELARTLILANFAADTADRNTPEQASHVSIDFARQCVAVWRQQLAAAESMRR